MTIIVFNTKIREVENKILDVNNVRIATALNTKINEVENKILDVSGLVKKTDFNPTISDIKAKYVTAFEYDKFTSGIIEENLKKRKRVSW